VAESALVKSGVTNDIPFIALNKLIIVLWMRPLLKITCEDSHSPGLKQFLSQSMLLIAALSRKNSLKKSLNSPVVTVANANLIWRTKKGIGMCALLNWYKGNYHFTT
jgi:hypothetical protein